MAPKNEYYRSTIEQLYEGKDSIIEQAKIINYDGERQVARVWTLTSNQYKDDVPVFFPSVFANTGIISPPVKDSTSMLVWGADRQPFLLPIQINTPNVQVKKGLTHLNASPGLADVLYTLKNIEGGEHILRSLGGAYIFLKNLGDVEIGTPGLHRLSLSEKDGALDIAIERIRLDTGNSRLYIGPASMDSNIDPRSHFYFELEEFTDEASKITGVSNEEMVNKVLDDSIDEIDLQDNPKIYKNQKGHVFSTDGQVKLDEEDGTELFSEEQFEKDSVEHRETLSKGGRKTFSTKTANGKSIISFSDDGIEITYSNTTNSFLRQSHIRIDREGTIWCGRDGTEYDLIGILEWAQSQR